MPENISFQETQGQNTTFDPQVNFPGGGSFDLSDPPVFAPLKAELNNTVSSSRTDLITTHLIVVVVVVLLLFLLRRRQRRVLLGVTSTKKA